MMKEIATNIIHKFIIDWDMLLKNGYDKVLITKSKDTTEFVAIVTAEAFTTKLTFAFENTSDEVCKILEAEYEGLDPYIADEGIMQLFEQVITGRAKELKGMDTERRFDIINKNLFTICKNREVSKYRSARLYMEDGSCVTDSVGYEKFKKSKDYKRMLEKIERRGEDKERDAATKMVQVDFNSEKS